MAASPDPTRGRAAAALAWLRAHQPFLILTHARPDGDALGSLIGALHVCRQAGLVADAYLPEEVPPNLQRFVPDAALRPGPVDLTRYRGLFCLDCATAARLALPPNLDLKTASIPVCNLDHHLDNEGYGEITCIDSRVAATAELLAMTFAATGMPLTPAGATALLLGVITDTGGFKHGNTTAGVLRTAAALIEAGADHHAVIQAAFYSESPNLLRLKAEVALNLKFAFDRRLVYFFITPAMLNEFGVETRETEDLIDVARTLAGVELVCRVQQVKDGVRFSLRSHNPALPVNGVARKLNGGGHAMAAGANVNGIDLAEAEALLLKHMEELLRG